jgi:hypothetical protein
MYEFASGLQLYGFVVGVKMVHPYLQSGTGARFAHLQNRTVDESSEKLGAASSNHISAGTCSRLEGFAHFRTQAMEKPIQLSGKNRRMLISALKRLAMER